MMIMSAGPTTVPQYIREALVKEFTNTDLDPDYIRFHRSMERKISRLLHTEATSFTMLGEAMLGLDGAAASFTESGKRVLILANGIFSRGFADLIRLYGGEPVILDFDDRRGIDPEQLEAFLKKDHDFSFATMVHCETPTGITNDIHAIGRLLSDHGILSVVDSVSGIGGEFLHFDEAQVDCVIGGSQKCLSVPAGITTITLSDRAIHWLKRRETPIPSFYSNFLQYLKKDDFEFPYTMNEHLVCAMDASLDSLSGRDFVAEHRVYAEKTRSAVTTAGLEIYARSHHSNTVTTVLLPEEISGKKLLGKLRQSGLILSGGIGPLHDKAIRIGHMGANIASEPAYLEMLRQLSAALAEAGVNLEMGLADAFLKA